MNRSNNYCYTNNFINLLAAHPYICAFAVCILINPFFLGAIENIPSNALWLESFIAIGVVSYFGFQKYKSGSLSKLKFILFEIIAVAVSLFAAKLYAGAHNKNLWHFIGGCIALLLLYYKADKTKYRTQLKALLILGMGFLLKLYYVLGTSVYTRQHDVGYFGGDIGHTGYIEYLLYNHHLPDFDVRERWQFCHPPLHHAISAIWISINENIFLVGHDPARESLQTLTLFYSMCIIISAYRILRHFKLQGMALYIPLIIISFHPAFILFSGSINNDVLSVAFVMGAVICTLKWYDNHTFKNILKIALCVGLGMMTKLSAAIVAPPIAVVFLVVFIKKFKTDWKKLFGQFCAFGAVCAPLGLWYEVRSYIKWKVPLNYVQELGDGVLQYIGNQSFISRITDFSPHQLKSVFEQWAYFDDNGMVKGYNEYNPLIAILKNSLFSESINESSFAENSFIFKISTLFFWIGILIVLLSLIAIVVTCFIKSKMRLMEKVFFGLFYVVLIVFFYKMAYDYPLTCTMDFRYITPTVIIGSLFIGLTMDKISVSNKKSCKTMMYSTGALALLFALCSTIIYIAVCYVVA